MPAPWLPTETRPLTVPAEGAGALRETVLIMAEHGVGGDGHLFAEVATKVDDLLTDEEWETLSIDGDRTIDLTIAEVDLLLEGLRFTEAASVEFPWYPMVIQTVHFMGDALMGLFTQDEWLAWRDG